MLFLQFILYSSSFAGTLKNETPGATLEQCQLKVKQFSPGILFSIKHEYNPFTLNFFMVPCTFLFIFHAGSPRLGSNNIKLKKPRPVRPVFPVCLSVSYDYEQTHKHNGFQLNIFRLIFFERKSLLKTTNQIKLN